MVSHKLSEREIQVLLMVCMDKSAEEISKTLNISTNTVYTHRKNILSKTGSKNKIGLVKFALKNGYF